MCLRGPQGFSAKSEHHIYDVEHEMYTMMQDAQEVGKLGATQIQEAVCPNSQAWDRVCIAKGRKKIAD